MSALVLLRVLARALALWLVLGAPVVANELREAGGSAPVLRYDPFARPEIPESDPEPRPQRASAQVRTVPWRARLKAVVVAGARSLANVEGVVLGLGESHAGYRLVEVGERNAVFERDGRRHTLALDDDRWDSAD